MFQLDHLGIAVASLAEAVPLFCSLLGVDESLVEYHDVPSEGIRAGMLRGNITIELLEPTSPDSPIARYLEKRGPGFHHYCFRAQGLSAHAETLAAAGHTLITSAGGEIVRQGAEGQVMFVHPKSAGGILTEFVELQT